MKSTVSLALAALVAVTAITFNAAPAAGATRQVAIGVAMLQDRNVNTLNTFRDSVGRDPAMWSIWSNWGAPNATRWFPGCTAEEGVTPGCDYSFLDTLNGRGITPVIWWQPATPGDDFDGKWQYNKIARGDHDDYLREWARQARGWGKTVIIRFAQEMNGYWFPWSVGGFAGNTPTTFKNAWRHMWDIIKVQEGATNVKFLWSPYGLPCGSTCTPLKNIYPGNAFVDYAGFSRFNWGGSQWIAMKRMMEKTMARLQTLSNKPIIVAEMASQIGPRGSTKNKGKWIRTGYPAVYNAWPRIVGIIYFNVDMRQHGQPNWTLDTRNGAIGAYRDVAADPRFQGSLSGSAPPPPPPPTGVQPPSAALVEDVKMSSKMQVRLNVSWPAVEGADAYELQQRINNNSWNTVALPSPTATSVERNIKPGRTLTYRLRARVGGTWSGWADGPVMPLVGYQERNSSLVYSGTWTRSSVNGAYGGYVRHNAGAGNTLTFTTTGRSIALVTTRAKGRGIAEITVDGGTPELVDLYQATLNSRYVAWTADLDPSQPHTIVVRVTTPPNPSAVNTRIDIDAFVVLR